MNNNTPGNCTGLVTNPDISGLGVRISFYVQNFLLVLLVNRSWSDAPSALLTFISTSFGLTLAAIFQAKDNQLSLFQAIQVSHLVWLANFGAFFALASQSRWSDRSRSEQKSARLISIVKTATVLQTILSMSLTIYMWRNAHHFGNQTECDRFVKYVLFGFELPVHGSGRVAGLTISSLLTAAYLTVTISDLLMVRKYQRPGPNRLPLENMSSSPNPPPPSPNLSPSEMDPTRDISTSPQNASSSQMMVAPRRGGLFKRQRWLANSDEMLIGIGLAQVLVFVYLVACSEQLIHHNRLAVSDTSVTQWSFGQIFSLVLVIPSVVSTASAFHEHRCRRMHYNNPTR